MSTLNIDEHTKCQSALQLVEEAFVGEIRDVIEQKVMEELLEDFEDRVRPMVRKQLESVTLAAIERSLDMMDIRDKLKVKFYHKEIVEHKIADER